LAGALVATVLLTVAVAGDWAAVTRFDDALTSFTRDWADPLGWPVDVAHGIGLVTAPRWSTLAAVVIVVVLFLARYRAAAGLLAVSAILGVALTELAKTAVGRMRPPGAGQYEPDQDRSFPSGHSSAGIYLYLATGVLLLQLGRARGDRAMTAVGWTLVVFGPSPGLTRLILGVHWPSDILAGWAFGSVGLLTSAVLLWWAVDAGWRRPEPDAEPAEA
jgi:undecaprenyl-diphosphatase